MARGPYVFNLLQQLHDSQDDTLLLDIARLDIGMEFELMLMLFEMVVC